MTNTPTNSFDRNAASIGTDRLPVSSLPSYSERAGWDARPPAPSREVNDRPAAPIKPHPAYRNAPSYRSF